MKVCVNGVSAIGWRAAAERQGCPSGGQFLCEAVLARSDASGKYELPRL